MGEKYSLRSDGNKKLTSHFSVREFRCKDGSDYIKIDELLVEKLQMIRDYFGKSVRITSAYRNHSHNKAVGGSPKSQHLNGTAADIIVSGVAPLLVAQYAEFIGFNGVGEYRSKGFTHVDTRSYVSRWNDNGSVRTFGNQQDFAKNPEPEKTEGEDMIKRYQSIGELPKALQNEAQELVKAGVLAGGANGLDVTEDMARTMIVSKRYVDKLHGK